MRGTGADWGAATLSLIANVAVRDAFGPLVAPQDVLAEASLVLEAYDARERRQLSQLSAYLSRYLVAPDPALGRAGPVCPFTSRSLRRRAMFVLAWRGDDADDSVAEAVSSLRDSLSSLWAASGEDDVFRSVSVVFPHLPAADAGAMVERVQARLKPSFVTRGLMLGEFHPTSDAVGLYSADFRPFRAPVAALSIRPMVVMDEPFLKSDDHSRKAYLDRFPVEGPARLARLVSPDRPLKLAAPPDRE